MRTSKAFQAHLELLSQPQQILDLAALLANQEMIAFDTEFIRETTFFPKVELIQVATEGEAWLVDATVDREILKPLLDVFQNKNILKILHAAGGDQECLFTAWGGVATPTFDTAIGAALSGYGEGVGLGNLLKAVMGVHLKKGHARTNWSVRPLPVQLAEYAVLDVQYLIPLARLLMGELDSLGRKEWALELSAASEDLSLYKSDPEVMAQKLLRGGRFDQRSGAALVELVRWREGRVRELNLPRRWVADDSVLCDLARVRPKDLAHLATFRGLNKGELKKNGEAILQAIRQGENEEITLPKGRKEPHSTAEESQAMELLRCYIGMLADRHRLAIKYLITSNQLLPLIRAEVQSVEDWVKQGLLSSWAAQLIGADVLAFLRGERALCVKDCKVQVVRLP